MINKKRGWLFAIIAVILVGIISYFTGSGKDIEGMFMSLFIFGSIAGLFGFAIGANVSLKDDGSCPYSAEAESSYYETDRATGAIIANLKNINRDLGNDVYGSDFNAEAQSSYYNTSRANGAIIAELNKLNYNKNKENNRRQK